jgi:hypothetical protein
MHRLATVAFCIAQLSCRNADDTELDNADAAVTGSECTTVWYDDADKDGHGDPAAATTSCIQPSDTVASKDDCDDRDADRYPGAMELCDGVDNDCNSVTFETCPMGCQPAKRPPPDTGQTYLFCNRAVSFQMAKSICAGQAFLLAHIDDAAENAWMRMTATSMFGGVTFNFGGNDIATEGVWLWDGTTQQFWQGGTGGASVGGLYNNWGSGEPNNSDNEDCTKMLPDGSWVDSGCGDNQRFVCER